LFLVLLNTALIPFTNKAAACPPDPKGDAVFDKNLPLGSNIVLDSSLFNVTGNPLSYEWYGPFSRIAEPSPLVFIPEGTYAVTLFTNNGLQRSDPHTLYFSVDPEYFFLPVGLKGKVVMAWLPVKGAQGYDIYRAPETDPSNFVKIAELGPSAVTYTDPNLKDATYLYVVGVLLNGTLSFSHVASAHPFHTIPKLNYPPVIYSRPVTPAIVGLPYMYDVLATDPQLDIMTYSLVSPPPGMTINPLTGCIQWTPPAIGDYEITVKVKDWKGASVLQTFITEVDELPPLNIPPVARAGGPYTGGVNQTITFDGSGSTDPNGSPLTYNWDFGDGSYGSGVSPTHKYTSPGIYAVKLTVSNNNGGTSSDTTKATIQCSPPTVSITANPAAIKTGDPCSLIWTSENAQSVSIDNGIGAVAASGSISVNPQSTTTYTITATGACGTQTQSVTITVYQPPTVSINATPTSIITGQTSILSWSSTNAVTVTIDNNIGAVPANSSLTVKPTTTTTYTIYATGPGGTATASVTLTVTPPPPPIVTLTANPASIVQGSSSTLTWSSANATTLSIDNGIGAVNPTGSTLVSPNQTTTYTITATGPGGTATSRATVTVTPAHNPPSIDSFTAACGNTPILQGTSTTLSWQCSNVDNVTTAYIDPVGTVNISASPLTISPQVTTTYTLTVSNQWGSASAQVTVKVAVPRTPLPDGSFGKPYEGFIPIDSTVQQYDAGRFSVVTGIVQDKTNAPLPGVSVTILGHPEYGTAQTDSTGRFGLPVEGGGLMTVVYSMNGFLNVHPNVNVPWNEHAVVDTIVMIQQDTAATTITLDGNSQSAFLHQSSTSSDSNGQRSCTLVFKGNTVATAVDANGNAIQTLPSSMSVRVTEYTVGDNGPMSMPALLPPQSAYTFCAEFKIDGVERVTFSNPVIAWEDNFLNLPVGTVVPVGYYNRDTGTWIAQKNGVVVKLLDTVGDGLVHALDATGNGQPTDLNGNGDFTDEVAGLQQNPSRFQPGKTFMRVEMSHFSIYDWNFAFLPADNKPPNPNSAPSVQGGGNQNVDIKPCPVPKIASSVEDRSQSVDEDIPIPGTDISLHYASSRSQGNKYTITIPASGNTVPSNLSSIIVQMTIAGEVYSETLTPAPNQTVTFVWDGMDAWGNQTHGPIPANIKIGFAYPACYIPDTEAASNPSILAFAQNSESLAWTFNSARQQAIIWKQYRLVVNKGSLDKSMAQSWTVSTNHRMYPYEPAKVYKGDGTVVSNELNRTIDTVANFLTSSSAGYPYDVAIDSKGNVYMAVVDYYAYTGGVYKLDTNNVLTRITPGSVISVAVDKDDTVYYSMGNYSAGFYIYKINPAGSSVLIAGGGNDCHNENIPATQALIYAWKIAVDSEKNIYFTEGYVDSGYRVRRIDKNGLINTVAGTRTMGPGNIPGPAKKASIEPQSVCFDDEGNMYIADLSDGVLKVDTSGYLSRIAGGSSNYGVSGSDSDGIPATQAYINASGILVDHVGNIYVSDGTTHKVRMIDTNGIITTLAGMGRWGFSGDGGLATSSYLYLPFGLALDQKGDLYIADSNNFRVREVSSAYGDIGSYKLDQGDIPFVEDGICYVFDYAGYHKRTFDVQTGAQLYAFGYDSNRNLTSVTNRFNETTTINYAGGVPSTIVSQDGISTALTLDAGSNLTDLTFSDGNGYHFDYNGGGLMTQERDPRGNYFVHTFDDTGKVTDVTDPEGGHWVYTRQVNQTTGETDYAITSGENNTTTYADTTDSAGFHSVITGPAGDQTNYFQSASDMHVEKTLSCGMSITSDYGLDAAYKYKFMNNLMETTGSLSRTTTFGATYADTNGDGIPDLITETSVMNGKTATLATNTINHIRTLTSPEGRVTTFTYDPGTLLTILLHVTGLTDTAYQYDNRGRPLAITTGSRTTSLAYNDTNVNDRTSAITDPMNFTTIYHYNSRDLLFQVDRPDGSGLSFNYDPNGNMTVLSKPSPTLGTTADHDFGYNRVNLSSSYQTPLNNTYAYAYNKDRQLLSISMPSGRQISNTYTNSLLTEVQMPEGNIDVTYSCPSKISTLTRGAQGISYGYNGSLLSSETMSGSLSQSLGYTYNNDFDVSAVTYAGGIMNLTYDKDRLLKQAGVYAITRDAGNGLPTTVSDGTITIGRTFNTYGEQASQSFLAGSSGHSWSLTYDNTGRITGKTETMNSTTNTFTYAYDSLGRLRTVTLNNSVVEDYSYGNNGARISEMNVYKDITTSRSLSYSNDDQVITAGGTSYVYDADGFLHTKTQGSSATTYTYTSRGELLRVNLPGGTVIEYDYDPLGRRITKKVNGSIIEKYLWQGSTRLLAVYNADNSLRYRFEYADARMPVAMTDGSSTRYYLSCDQVGSLRLVTDTAGNVVKRVDYDTFGYVVNDTNPSFTMPFGFAGGVYDGDTGMIRFGARDYDPDTGRWTAKDPILFKGGDTDLYGYCVSDPVNYRDPKGTILQETEIAIKIALPIIAGGLEATTNIPEKWGPVGNTLEIASGASGIFVSEIMLSTSSSLPIFLPFGLALGSGLEIGLAFNRLYEEISGQSLGADIYNWTYRRKESNLKPCH
jgi:RHS repeat-associated protein